MGTQNAATGRQAIRIVRREKEVVSFFRLLAWEPRSNRTLIKERERIGVHLMVGCEPERAMAKTHRDVEVDVRPRVEGGMDGKKEGQQRRQSGADPTAGQRPEQRAPRRRASEGVKQGTGPRMRRGLTRGGKQRAGPLSRHRKV